VKAKGDGTRAPSTGLPARGPGKGPARRYSWQPFAAENLAALRSGVWSRRKVDPIASEFVLGLLADRPDLGGYPEAVAAWARAEARCVLLAEHFADGLIADGQERPGLRYVAQFERLASTLRERLGLDPRSEAELARDRVDAVRDAVDLDALRERGRELRLASEGKEA